MLSTALLGLLNVTDSFPIVALCLFLSRLYFTVPFHCVMQAPEKLSVVMDDGFNVVQYTFHLQSVNEATTSVCCEVHHFC